MLLVGSTLQPAFRHRYRRAEERLFPVAVVQHHLGRSDDRAHHFPSLALAPRRQGKILEIMNRLTIAGGVFLALAMTAAFFVITDVIFGGVLAIVWTTLISLTLFGPVVRPRAQTQDGRRRLRFWLVGGRLLLGKRLAKGGVEMGSERLPVRRPRPSVR